jgi:hypothetical protein
MIAKRASDGFRQAESAAGWMARLRTRMVARRNVSVAPGRPDYQPAGRTMRSGDGRRYGKAEVVEDRPGCFSFGQHCQDAERAAAGVAHKHVQHENVRRKSSAHGR